LSQESPTETFDEEREQLAWVHHGRGHLSVLCLFVDAWMQVRSKRALVVAVPWRIEVPTKKAGASRSVWKHDLEVVSEQLDRCGMPLVSKGDRAVKPRSVVTFEDDSAGFLVKAFLSSDERLVGPS
jgi:hypothetical protein